MGFTSKEISTAGTIISFIAAGVAGFASIKAGQENKERQIQQDAAFNARMDRCDKAAERCERVADRGEAVIAKCEDELGRMEAIRPRGGYTNHSK